MNRCTHSSLIAEGSDSRCACCGMRFENFVPARLDAEGTAKPKTEIHAAILSSDEGTQSAGPPVEWREGETRVPLATLPDRYVVRITRPSGEQIYILNADYIGDDRNPAAEVWVGSRANAEAIAHRKMRYYGRLGHRYEVVPALPEHTRAMEE